MPGGRVMVNDALHHQLKLFDSTLTSAVIVLDSVPGSATSYGPRPLPLLAYLGDSSLSADVNAGTLLMLSPTGQVVRAVAAPYANLTTSLRLRYSGVDNKGRILFQGRPAPMSLTTSIADRVAGIGRDSVAIMRARADLESRRVDTIAYVKQGGATEMLGRATETGPVRFSTMPVQMVDVWGVLSDGSVGIVRGQDYHVDWILADGTKRSTPKLPFDWKRLTDEDKLRLIDSTRVTASATLSQCARHLSTDWSAAGRPRQPRRPRICAAGSECIAHSDASRVCPPELSGDIPDYYPSVRVSAAIADLDGNLWILPNTSAQSRNGELVYDVVNPKGDFHRVRLPVGRSIAGFGKGGVIFLQGGDRASGFSLERARMPK